MYTFSATSNALLVTVHPDLQRVMRRAIATSTLDFKITEGIRTVARQRQLVRAGASRTMNSRHITGHAVDVAVLVTGKVRWDWPLYLKLAEHIKKCSQLEKVPLVWGGDWIKFRDGPHYELDRKVYK